MLKETIAPTANSPEIWLISYISIVFGIFFNLNTNFIFFKKDKLFLCSSNFLSSSFSAFFSAFFKTIFFCPFKGVSILILYPDFLFKAFIKSFFSGIFLFIRISLVTILSE